MKYDFDSYLLYEVTKSSLYTVRIIVELNVPQAKYSGELRKKAFRRFPYSRTSGQMSMAPMSWSRAKPICVFEEEAGETGAEQQTASCLRYAAARVRVF